MLTNIHNNKLKRKHQRHSLLIHQNTCTYIYIYTQDIHGKGSNKYIDMYMFMQAKENTLTEKLNVRQQKVQK